MFFIIIGDSVWKSSPGTAQRPRPNWTVTAQDRKFDGPIKTVNRGPVCGPSYFGKFQDRKKTGLFHPVIYINCST